LVCVRSANKFPGWHIRILSGGKDSCVPGALHLSCLFTQMPVPLLAEILYQSRW